MDVLVPTYSRRRFLRVLGGGALLAAWPAPLLAEAGAITVSVLHTTDLHGHILPTTDYHDRPDLGGLARCATQIRAWQRENPQNVLVDIGDIFQGTPLGLGTRGEAIVRCFNALAYDGWVIGNHEFDAGPETLARLVELSAMPVLSGNARVGGHAIDAARPASDAFARLRPWFIKEVAGFRIAFVGLTTPGLPAWLPPENLGGFEVLDPIESLRRLLPAVAAQKPDAILLAGHMGLTRQDDFANRVGALTREFPQLTAFLGGHTHQNHASEIVHGVLYTQADHFGIYAGRLDLTFDPASRRLLQRRAVTIPMDSTVPLDPAVLALVRYDLDVADRLLAQPIGEVTATLGVDSAPGHPSAVERLVGSAMLQALVRRGVTADVVVHGLFDTRHPLPPGAKTVADLWTLLPYENTIVTLDLPRADLLALARDFQTGPEFRSVMGVTLMGTPAGRGFAVTDMRARDGSPLPEKPLYRVALNAYDAQSAGERFLVAGRLSSRASSRRVLHPVTTRDALADFFLARKRVGPESLTV